MLPLNQPTKNKGKRTIVRWKKLNRMIFGGFPSFLQEVFFSCFFPLLFSSAGISSKTTTGRTTTIPSGTEIGCSDGSTNRRSEISSSPCSISGPSSSWAGSRSNTSNSCWVSAWTWGRSSWAWTRRSAMSVWRRSWSGIRSWIWRSWRSRGASSWPWRESISFWILVTSSR